MHVSDSRNRELSKDLRKLVCESIGYQKQRFSWDRIDTGTDKGEIFNKPEDIGKRLLELPGQNQRSWQERGAVLESRKSEVLAAMLLERMQSVATVAVQESIHNEQRTRVRR